MRIETLGLFLLVVAAFALVECKEGHQKRNKPHQTSKHHESKGHLARASNDTNGLLQTFQGAAHNIVHFFYNQTRNFLCVYNPMLQMVGILGDLRDLITITNLTSGGYFMLDPGKNQGAVNLRMNVTLPKLGSVRRMCEFVFDTALGGAVSIFTDAFNIGGFLEALSKGDVGGFFGNAVQIPGRLAAGFGKYFQGLARAAQSGIMGIGAFFAPFFGAVGAIPRAFSNFFTAIIGNSVQLGRFFVQQFFGVIGGGGRNVANLLGFFTNAVRGVGSIYSNLSQALLGFLSGNRLTNFTSNVIPAGDRNISVIGGISDENWWLVKIGDRSNSSGNVTLYYNATSNIFGFYNVRFKLGAVFTASLTFGITNATTGATLVVNQFSGNARYVPPNPTIATKFRTNVTEAFGLIVAVINANSEGLAFPICLDSDCFSFRIFIYALRVSPQAADVAFIGKGDLSKTVWGNFYGLLNRARWSFQNGNNGLQSWGVFGIFSTFMNLPNSIVSTIVNFIGGFFGRGGFSPQQMAGQYFRFLADFEGSFGIHGNASLHLQFGGTNHTA